MAAKKKTAKKTAKKPIKKTTKKKPPLRGVKKATSRGEAVTSLDQLTEGQIKLGKKLKSLIGRVEDLEDALTELTTGDNSLITRIDEVEQYLIGADDTDDTDDTDEEDAAE